MNNINVLILSAGRRVELVKSFKSAIKEANVQGKVIAVDLQKTAPALYFADEYFNISSLKNDNYIDDLVSICLQNDVKLVIPTIDTELEILSLNKARIEELTGAKIMVCEKLVIDIIRNKIKTYEFLKKHNLRAPYVITDKDIKNRSYKFPLFIKPYDGSSSQNSYKINNEEELKFFKKYVEKPLIQEFIDGVEYCVDVFTDFDGKPITIVPKIRMASRAGEISKGKIEKNIKIISEIKRLVSVLKPIGEINVDCIINNELVYIIEINGRFAGGSPMSFNAGANSPLNLIKLLKNEKLDYNEEYKEGMIALRFDECIYLED